MSLSPTDIAYFLEVARQGHLGRAAQACGVTQPTITKALHRLEGVTGAPLFERGAQGARLTSEGQLFLEAARRLLAQHLDAQRTAAEIRARHAGLLRLGVTNPGAETAPVWAMSEMVRQRPGLRLRLVVGKSDALHAAVEAGDLDLAVVPSYPGLPFTAACHVIGEDQMQVGVRARHPLLALPEPGLAHLAEYGWVMPSEGSAARRLVADVFARAGLPTPSVILETDYVSEAVLGVVGATDLLVLVSAGALRATGGRIVPLYVPELRFQRGICLLSRRQATWSPLMVAFRDLLVSHCAGASAL